MAARIRTPSRPFAEDDDRRVGHDRGLVGGVAQRRRGVGELLVQRQPRLADRAPRRARGDQLREPFVLGRAEPDQAFDVEREALVEGAQPPLGAELEERVGLQPRLLGLAVLAGAGGGLHAVERERDQVVVGLVGLLGPFRRHRGLQRARRLRGDLLHLLVRGDALLLLGRDPDQPPELVERTRGALGARAVALGQLVAQVAEGADGAGAERDRLGDLEVARDLVVLDAAPVLDRHQLEELQQLLGAAGGLLGRERRGGEADQCVLRALDGGGEVGRLGQRGERLRGLRLGGGAAVLGVAGSEDREVARGLRGGLGAPRGQVLLDAAAGVVEQLAQPCLVGVEQVLARRPAPPPGPEVLRRRAGRARASPARPDA